MKPRLLDLFSGAGGAAMGYRRAGFDVVGVDIKPQPHYPFEFYIADAVGVLEGLLEGGYLADVTEHSEMWLTPSMFGAIHASPPCPGYSTLAAMHPERSWPLLIEPVRSLLEQIGLPWVIENVETAPLTAAPTLDGAFGVMLCGSMFGLGVERGFLRRHRLFETTFSVAQPSCSHRGVAVGVYGHGGHSGKHRMLYRKEAAEALGIDWMNRDELADAVPPAYTEHIGGYLMAEVQRRSQDAA